MHCLRSRSVVGLADLHSCAGRASERQTRHAHAIGGALARASLCRAASNEQERYAHAYASSVRSALAYVGPLHLAFQSRA